MAAAPDGQVTMTLPDATGTSVIVVFIQWNPATDLFTISPPVTVTNSTVNPIRVLIVEADGTQHSVNVPVGTTTLTNQQLTQANIPNHAALGAVTLDLA